MKLVIDLVILFVIVFGVWRGYKNGLIRGVCGVLALVVSIFLANVAATAYSDEFTGMLTPFVSGVVDASLADMLELDDSQTYSAYETSYGAYGTAVSVLTKLGLPKPAAETVAKLSTDGADFETNTLSELITDKLSSIFAYVAVFGIGFILLAIIFAVIGNLIGLVFAIPGMAKLDAIAGAAFGLAKGLIIIYAVTSLVRYIGVLSPSTIEETAVLEYFVNNNPIASILGI